MKLVENIVKYNKYIEFKYYVLIWGKYFKVDIGFPFREFNPNEVENLVDDIEHAQFPRNIDFDHVYGVAHLSFLSTYWKEELVHEQCKKIINDFIELLKKYEENQTNN